MSAEKRPSPLPTVFTNAVDGAGFKPTVNKKGAERGRNAEISDAMFKRALRDRKEELKTRR